MDTDWSVELGADDPALQFPWVSPDGSRGYVDLLRHPEAIATITETIICPELSELLLVLNNDISPWLTAKCDVWQEDELSEAELIYDAKLKFCSYIDLVARDFNSRFSFGRHEAWVKAAASALSSTSSNGIACEFIVRRCWFGATDGRQYESVPGFCVTLYLFGYGDLAEARANWAHGLRQATTLLASSAP